MRQPVHIQGSIGTSSAFCTDEFGRALGAGAVGAYAAAKPDADEVNAAALTPAAGSCCPGPAIYRAGTGSSEMTIPAVAGFVGGWTLFHEVMPHVGDAPKAAAVRAAALAIHLPMGAEINGGGVWYIPRPMQPPRLDSPPERLGMQPAAARAAAIGVLALGLEWARAMAARQPEIALVCLVVGGVALGALGLGFAASQLGLSRSRLAFTAGLAHARRPAAPAERRPGESPAADPGAVRGGRRSGLGRRGDRITEALFAAIESWLGPGPAILGSSLVFAAGHLLSHPPQFLLAVTAMSLLPAVWRWACGDLVAPIVAHCIADLAL